MENICKVFYIKKVNLVSGMLRILLFFCIFAPSKKGNDMAEIANRIYETSEGQILFISDLKSASYKGLEERHAKLAVGSSITLVEFLWCTHERTKSKQNIV